MRPFPTIFSFCFLLAGAASAAPIAEPDPYEVFEDSVLQVAAPGVLTNDNPNGATGQLQAALVTGPGNGVAALSSDGSFTYTPAANFHGLDTFTYRVVESPGPVTFTIDQPNSVMNVQANSQTFITGGTTDSKSTTAQVSGTVSAQITPPSSPFANIQVQSIYAQLAQPISLTLCVQRILICTASLTASVNTNPAPEGLRISMNPSQAGPEVPVNGAGVFNQLGNKLDINGRVNLTGSGLAGLITIPPTADLNTINQPFDFNNATITQSGATLTISVPIDVTQTITESGDPINPGQYRVTVRVSGTIRATAPVPPIIQSDPTTVAVTVFPVNDLPVLGSDRYYTRQNLPVSIPASAVVADEILIGNGNTPAPVTVPPGVPAWVTDTNPAPAKWWKYHDLGLNLGTAWRSWHYNDSAWASNGTQLGYGDNDEFFRVQDGPDPLNLDPIATQYPTLYFRKEFTLTNPFNTVGVWFDIVRDDAAVVYVNGAEVCRDTNLPAAAIEPNVLYTTRASAAVAAENAPAFSNSFGRNNLLEGRNVIAVEVHQTATSNSDMGFDLRLRRTTGVAGLLSNDADVVEGSALSALVYEQPANGLVSIGLDGGFTYTPNPGFSGTDTFVYRVREDGADTVGALPLVNRLSSWKFLTPTADQSLTDWKAATFDDAAWTVGSGPLGYGDASIAVASTIDFGADPGNKPITYYFRKSFTLPIPKSLVGSLTFKIRRDDGVSVHLNGTEVVRDNLPGTLGDATIAFSTPAPAAVGNADELTYYTYTAPASFLVEGANQLAVEVHQNGPASSDLIFDLELIAETIPGSVVTMIVLDDDLDNDAMSDTWERANAVDALAANDQQDADGDGQTNRNEFLAGTDPHNPGQVFRIASVAPAPGDTLDIQCSSVVGRRYQLRHSPDLLTWQDLGSPTAPASGAIINFTVPTPLSREYFKVEVDYDWQ